MNASKDTLNTSVVSLRISASRRYAPLVASLAYLGGTFVLFLVVGQVTLVPNLFHLTLFVASTLVALSLGYHLRTRSLPRVVPPRLGVPGREVREVERWVLISATYYALFGLALLLEYGARSVTDVLQAILNPGDAYFAKFKVYEFQRATGEKNLAIQILTLLSILYVPLIPFVIVYRRHLTRWIRYFAVFGATVYASFFLFIGTLKGLGDLLIFAIAGYAALALGSWKRKEDKSLSKTTSVTIAAMLISVFLGYMAFNQSQRVNQAGVADQFPPNPIMASLVNEEFARGVTVVAFYPTHGYLGLAYNLETPFVWTGGRGSSFALDSYWAQYLGAESKLRTTYPLRTEGRTGWPALRYWATAYPWFASDFTFPGTVVLMVVVGWFLAQTWHEGAFERRQLSLLMFGQLALLVAFLPANNQIGASRPSLIAFVCLSLLYVMSRSGMRRSLR